MCVWGGPFRCHASLDSFASYAQRTDPPLEEQPLGRSRKESRDLLCGAGGPTVTFVQGHSSGEASLWTGRVGPRPRPVGGQGHGWDVCWELSPTCFFRLSISERSLCITRLSSEISIFVVRRSSPCRPADRCSSSYWGRRARGRGGQARGEVAVASRGPRGFQHAAWKCLPWTPLLLSIKFHLPLTLHACRLHPAAGPFLCLVFVLPATRHQGSHPHELSSPSLKPLPAWGSPAQSVCWNTWKNLFVAPVRCLLPGPRPLPAARLFSGRRRLSLALAPAFPPSLLLPLEAGAAWLSLAGLDRAPEVGPLPPPSLQRTDCFLPSSGCSPGP